MEALKQIVLDRMSSPVQGDNVSASIEKASKMFPEEMRPRFVENMNRMVSHEWRSKKDRRKALESVRAMCQALNLGIKRQAVLQYVQAEDRMFYDYSKQLVKVAKSANIRVKHMGAFAPDERSRINIVYKGKRWVFTPAESYKQALPPEALNNAERLKRMGFTWDGFFVGIPAIVQRDPIFAVSVGRWLLRLHRW